MELCLIVLIVCASNVLCVLLSRTGAAPKEPAIFNPIEKIKERKENKELSREQKEKQEAIKTMMHNIDMYDGTEVGQRDV